MVRKNTTNFINYFSVYTMIFLYYSIYMANIEGRKWKTSYAKTYYYKHKDKILADQRRRRENPEYREKLRLYYREYYKENRVRLLERAKLKRRLGTFYDLKTYKDEDRAIEIKRGKFVISFD
jgi:hypothetical protein